MVSLIAPSVQEAGVTETLLNPFKAAGVFCVKCDVRHSAKCLCAAFKANERNVYLSTLTKIATLHNSYMRDEKTPLINIPTTETDITVKLYLVVGERCVISEF